MSDSIPKTITDWVPCLNAGLSSVRAEQANLYVDWDEIAQLVQQMRDEVGKSLFTVSTEFWKSMRLLMEEQRQMFTDKKLSKRCSVVNTSLSRFGKI